MYRLGSPLNGPQAALGLSLQGEELSGLGTRGGAEWTHAHCATTKPTGMRDPSSTASSRRRKVKLVRAARYPPSLEARRLMVRENCAKENGLAAAGSPAELCVTHPPNIEQQEEVDCRDKGDYWREEEPKPARGEGH